MVRNGCSRWLLSGLLAFWTAASMTTAWASAPRTAPTIEYLPALAGDYFPIASREIGRTFHVYVRLPPGYDPKHAMRYPVVYVLDGDSLFPLLAASHLFIAMDDGLPEAVIVGIAYGSFDPTINRRDVDFMPPAPGKPAAGGAPAFARFLARELAPRVERSYAVDPTRRILFGQSRGGTFVLYSAIADPDFFWGRIASNPSMSAGREALAAPAGHSARRDLTLVVAIGTADRAASGAETLAWLDGWRRRDDVPWRVESVTIDGGTHAANVGEAYRRALRALFTPAR